MTKQYVRVTAEVHCSWEGLPPIYRVYVDNELFSERTWIWTDSYLEEHLQILADPGNYQIRFELVPPYLAQLWVKNMQVNYGLGQIENNEILRIPNESQ